MKDIKPSNIWIDIILYATGIIAIGLLFAINIAYYRYNLEVTTRALIIAASWGVLYLYLCYEYFETLRMYERLQKKIQEIESSKDITASQ